MSAVITAGESRSERREPARTGGDRRSWWQRSAAIAAASGRLVSSHLFVEVSTHLLGATPTAHWLEYADWWNPILREPLVVENGVARVDQAVATGVAWNDKAVERFSA